MLTIEEFENFLKTNVPMIEYSGMSILKLDEDQSVIKMPFISQNMNHVQSMYFASLAIGADAAAGVLALYNLNIKNVNSTVVFKDFKANFIRRANSDVFFICKDREIINDSINLATEKRERVNFPVRVVATQDLNKIDPVAEFKLTVSIKLIKES